MCKTYTRKKFSEMFFALTQIPSYQIELLIKNPVRFHNGELLYTTFQLFQLFPEEISIVVIIVIKQE